MEINSICFEFIIGDSRIIYSQEKRLVFIALCREKNKFNT